MKNSVIIYRSHLLPPSETFILSQGELLQNFTPYYIGSHLIAGLPLPEDRSYVVNNGGILGLVEEVLFIKYGIAPSLLRKLKQITPCLIHAHFGTDAIRAIPLAKYLKIPLIVTFHGFDATVSDEYAKKSFHSHRVYIQKREALKREAFQFIAVSNFIQSKLLEQGYPPEKIVVHHIGVDTDYFQPDSSVSRQPLVLFVGRLVENKGCEYLIKAMAIVQREIPEASLCIIGDGPLRSSLESLSQNTLKNCSFLGSQTPSQVKYLC
jgi:colanic acid/amylovoran biosynthesis glycosyltransferase